MRLLLVTAAAATLLVGCGDRIPAVDATPPSAADPASARLVAAEGRGARRLSLWVARNGDGDICPGWTLGGARPASYRCQRRALERPVLWVEGGGGGENIPWGGDVGLVAPGVTRVAVDGVDVRLRPVAGLEGWRSFAGSSGGRPGSELVAYAAGRELLDDTGLWVTPEQPTFAYVPEQQHGADARATALALAVPGVRRVLRDHGPAWIDMPVGLEKCDGGALGESVPLRLWKPSSFHATLPFAELAPEHLDVAYLSGEHRVFAVHSNELLVSVDTNAWRVIGVETDAESGVEIPLGDTVEPRPGGGYDDPSACPEGD